MNKVIIVAPHPDDETLGCGGTICKHKANGDQVFWLIATNVDAADGWDGAFVEKRQKEIEEAAHHYDFDGYFKLDFPTTRLDALPYSEMIPPISDVFSKVEPEVVYLPNRSDVHTDHHHVFQAAYSCTKNFRHPFIRRIVMYETLSETDFAPPLPGNPFVPNVFIDISPYFKRKLEAFEIFESEVMKPPFPRSLETVEALARLRGARIGVEFAEAFMLLEEIL